MEEGYATVLQGLGLDPTSDPHLADTARRAAKAMVYELCGGFLSPPPKMTTFPLQGEAEMVISRDIPVRSLCAHHLLPFIGTAAVAYIPHQRILGLSKLSRVVDWLSRRPQVQEDLTSAIADFLRDTLDLRDHGGVGVVIAARHCCMEVRGVVHPSNVVTSALRGEFTHPEVRAEFLSLAEVRK